jgi:hypothetical protein
MTDVIDSILNSILAEDGPLTEEDMQDVREFNAAIEKAARICDAAAAEWKKTADSAYELDHNEAKDWSGRAEARAETASNLAADIRRAALATSPASDAEPVKKLKLWFFRDLSGEQRGKLIALFGMNDAQKDTNHGYQDKALSQVIAALAAAPASAEPVVGWQMVPCEPTDEMLDELSDGVATVTGNLRNNWRTTYKNMLASAPVPPVDGEVDDLSLWRFWNSKAKEQAEEIDRLREALGKMLQAVCGETGFANAVRQVSGLAYPWPALDEAEAKARTALTNDT